MKKEMISMERIIFIDFLLDNLKNKLSSKEDISFILTGREDPQTGTSAVYRFIKFMIDENILVFNSVNIEKKKYLYRLDSEKALRIIETHPLIQIGKKRFPYSALTDIRKYDESLIPKPVEIIGLRRRK